MRLLILSCLLLASLAHVAAAQPVEQAESNWHQWRGPNGNGLASQGNPPVEWSPEKNIKWKTAIPGRGNASPIVWGDKIFIATAIDTGKPDPNAPAADAPAAAENPGPPPGEDFGRRGGRRGFGGFGRFGGDSGPRNIHQFIVMCLDRHSGDILWQKVAREAAPHEGKHGDNTYASGSPTTDGKRLYVTFGSQGIFCYDLDGNELWNVDLGDMQTRNSFGEGASPTVYKDALVVPWDQESSSKLYVLDAATGEKRWEKDRDEVTTWITPLVVEAAGKTQIIINGDNRIRSYDLATGDVIWECGGLGTNPIPVPVVFEDLVFCMTGHREPGAVAVPLDSKKGDVTDSDTIAWRTTQGTPYVPSPLLVGDQLYFTKGNNAVLSCLNARTGEPIINQDRIPGIDNIYASPVSADGRIYITGRDGTTVVLKHGDKVEVLATNSVGEPVDASPAIIGDKMYIRGYEHLLCIGEN